MAIEKVFQSEHVALNTYFNKQQYLDVENVAANQWLCIDALVKKYQNMVFTKLKYGTQFFDDKWESRTKKILWNKHATADNFPFLLLCRIVAYSEIEVQDNRSFFTKTNTILNNHDPFRTSRVLHAHHNEPMVPMSFQETVDIENFIIASGLQSFELASFFSKLRYLPPEYTQNASFLSLVCDLPWLQIKLNGGCKNSVESKYMNVLKGKNISESRSYKPISTDNVAAIVKFSIPLINNHASDLIEIFKTASRYRTSVRKDGSGGVTILSKGRDIILKHKQWLSDELDYQYTDSNHNSGNMYFSWIQKLYWLVQSSCLWILMLTTALRNLDIRNLKYNCYVKATNSNDLFYLITDIQKTKIEDFVIPICQNTVNSIELLKNISQVSDDETDFLVRRYINQEQWKRQASLKKGESLNWLIRKLCDYLELDIKDNIQKGENSEGLSHRIRYTMAEFIGTHSPIATLLLQRLFGHKGSAMSNMYLSSIKAVQVERERIEYESRVDIANCIANAIVNKKISGKAGHKLAVGADYVKNEIKIANPSMTEGELHITLIERLNEIIQSKIARGSVYALQTPMGVICMRSPMLTDDAPCATREAKFKRQESKISRAFTEAVGMLPDPGNCIGIKCPHALLADPISNILLEQFDFYAKYLAGIGYTGIDLIVEATNFINLYRQPLTDIFGELATYANIRVTNV